MDTAMHLSSLFSGLVSDRGGPLPTVHPRLTARGASSSSTGPIIAAVVCGVFAFFSVTTLVLMCTRRRREIRDKETAVDLRSRPFPLSAKPGRSTLQSLHNAFPVASPSINALRLVGSSPSHGKPGKPPSRFGNTPQLMAHPDTGKLEEGRRRSSISKPVPLALKQKWHARLPPISQGYGVGAGWYVSLDETSGAQPVFSAPSRPPEAKQKLENQTGSDTTGTSARARSISRTVSSLTSNVERRLSSISHGNGVGVRSHGVSGHRSSKSASRVLTAAAARPRKRQAPSLRIIIPGARTASASKMSGAPALHLSGLEGTSEKKARYSSIWRTKIVTRYGRGRRLVLVRS